MKWKYGFVTFERPIDAYTAIDNSSKNPDIREYDISFGGRRAFCREKYLDLGKTKIYCFILSSGELICFSCKIIDNTGSSLSQDSNGAPIHNSKEDNSFEALLRKAKQQIGVANK